jgi:hypothetical protein
MIKRWTDNEDAYLIALKRQHWDNARLAKRFDTTEEEIIQHHAELLNSMPRNKPAASNEVSESELPREEEPMDATQLAFLNVCKNYEQVGEGLKIFSEMISANLAEEHIAAHIEDLTAKYNNLGNLKPSLPVFLARVLHANYIFVPRLQLVNKIKADKQPDFEAASQ